MIPHDVDALVTEPGFAPTSSAVSSSDNCSSSDAVCAAIMLGAAMRMLEEHTPFASVSGFVETSTFEAVKVAPTLVAMLVAAVAVS